MSFTHELIVDILEDEQSSKHVSRKQLRNKVIYCGERCWVGFAWSSFTLKLCSAELILWHNKTLNCFLIILIRLNWDLLRWWAGQSVLLKTLKLEHMFCDFRRGGDNPCDQPVGGHTWVWSAGAVPAVRTHLAHLPGQGQGHWTEQGQSAEHMLCSNTQLQGCGFSIDEFRI